MQQNISIDKSDINLRPNETYIVIDAAYISSIRNEFFILNKENVFDEIEKKFFLYTETPFAGYISIKETFSVTQIKKNRL